MEDEDIVRFTEMTGDRNALHYDRAVVERSGFGRIIVQGGVTSGLLNAVVAEDLPGPGARLPQRELVVSGTRGPR